MRSHQSLFILLLTYTVIFVLLRPYTVSAQVPFEYGEYTPIKVEHQVGVKVQILPWGTEFPSSLPERHFLRNADYTIWCAPPGQYAVNVGTDEWRLVDIVEGPGSNPKPPPGPFDDLARKVSEWTEGLPNNQEYGELYLEYSEAFLNAEPNETAEDIVNQFNEEVRTLPNQEGYSTLRTNVAADLEDRWPMSKQALSAYYKEISIGLGVEG